MIEPDRQQPPSVHVLDTAMAATGAQVSAQVPDRLGHAGVVGLKHRPPGRRIAEPREDRHALGRPQDHIKGGHGVAAVGTAQQQRLQPRVAQDGD